MAFVRSFDGETQPTADELLSTIESHQKELENRGTKIWEYQQKIKDGTVTAEEKEVILSAVQHLLEYMDTISQGIENVNNNIGAYEGIKNPWTAFVQEYEDALDVAGHIQTQLAK